MTAGRHFGGIVIAAIVLVACAWSDVGPLRRLYYASLTVHTPVNVVAGTLHGETIFCVQGDVMRDGKRIAAVDVIRDGGKYLFTITEPGPTGSSQSGAYLHWI